MHTALNFELSPVATLVDLDRYSMHLICADALTQEKMITSVCIDGSGQKDSGTGQCPDGGELLI